ncbi:thermonuclease family protein, partial [Rhizobium phaseoli]
MLERFGLLPFFLISLGSTSIPAETQQLLGRASVVDGDTIEIGGRRIRLNGVDAPESWQVCQDGAKK